MTLTEDGVKKLVGACVRDIGREVTRDELTKWIEANYEFDEDDLRMSPSRPKERAYEQRIRNIKSHHPYVSGVGLCEVGYGAYIRWLDPKAYVLGDVHVSTCPPIVGEILAEVQEFAVSSSLDYLVAHLGGRRLPWVRKARIAGDPTVDIVLPNAADEGRSCSFIKVVSTTHKVARMGRLGLDFELPEGFSKLLELSMGYSNVGVMVVMEPKADLLSFGGFELLEGDRLSDHVENGVLSI